MVTNLLDEEYTDFLNPYKGFRPYPDDPRQSTLNPGREIRIHTMYQF